MSKLTYTNTFHNRPGEYDPETEGSFAVAFRPGETADLGDGITLGLAFGGVSSPQKTLEAAVADYALIVAKYPAVKGRLGIYKIPCVWSTRDGWKEVNFFVPPALAESAAVCARSNWYGTTDAYKRENEMSSLS